MSYEITFEAPNGDWHYWRIEARDFHGAVLNAVASMKQRPHDRLVSIQRI